jgi:hypothetical protein
LLPLIFNSVLATLGETKLGLIFDNWDKLIHFFPRPNKNSIFSFCKIFQVLLLKRWIILVSKKPHLIRSAIWQQRCKLFLEHSQKIMFLMRINFLTYTITLQSWIYVRKYVLWTRIFAF